MVVIPPGKQNCFKSAQPCADLASFTVDEPDFASKASEKAGTRPATLISNA